MALIVLPGPAARAAGDDSAIVEDAYRAAATAWAAGSFYYPEPRARGGKWRTVEVDVGRRGVRPRWRSGYFDR